MSTTLSALLLVTMATYWPYTRVDPPVSGVHEPPGVGHLRLSGCRQQDAVRLPGVPAPHEEFPAVLPGPGR